MGTIAAERDADALSLDADEHTEALWSGASMFAGADEDAEAEHVNAMFIADAKTMPADALWIASASSAGELSIA